MASIRPNPKSGVDFRPATTVASGGIVSPTMTQSQFGLVASPFIGSLARRDGP